MNDMTPVFFTLAVLVAYPLIAFLAMRLTAPARLELAHLGRNLLDDPTVSDEHKELVAAMLDDIFDWRFLAFACYAFPLMAFRALAGRERIRFTEADRRFLVDGRVTRLFELHMLTVSAASPFWAVLFRLVAVVTVAILLLFIGLSAVSLLWADTVQDITHRVPTHHPNNTNHEMAG